MIVRRESDGFGFTLSQQMPVFVDKVFPGSSAERARVSVGDRILKVKCNAYVLYMYMYTHMNAYICIYVNTWILVPWVGLQFIVPLEHLCGNLNFYFQLYDTMPCVNQQKATMIKFNGYMCTGLYNYF